MYDWLYPSKERAEIMFIFRVGQWPLLILETLGTLSRTLECHKKTLDCENVECSKCVYKWPSKMLSCNFVQDFRKLLVVCRSLFGWSIVGQEAYQERVLLLVLLQQVRGLLASATQLGVSRMLENKASFYLTSKSLDSFYNHFIFIWLLVRKKFNLQIQIELDSKFTNSQFFDKNLNQNWPKDDETDCVHTRLDKWCPRLNLKFHS
jgi:hypothetical protein